MKTRSVFLSFKQSTSARTKIIRSNRLNSADFRRKRNSRGPVDRGEDDLDLGDGDDDDGDGSGSLIIEKL